MTASKRKIDFTSGKIFSKILVFAFPIILTNLLQVFYNAADMMVVSLSDEPNAVGAVGVTSSFVSLILNIFIGFSVGSNVTIARRIGANDKDGVSKATHTAVLLSVILGLICMIVGLSVSRTVLSLMGNTGNVLYLAHRYTFFYFLGIPFIATSNFLVSIFRAKGDSETPLKVLAFSGLMNVLMNLFFVLVLGMSVEGVAIATVMANLISTVILATKLTRADDNTRLQFSKLRIDVQSLRDIIIIGLPSSIQSILVSLSNMMIQSSVVTLNKNMTPDPNLSPVMNGNAAQANLENFVYTTMNAVYQATTTFTSQNFGAGKIDRIKKGFRTNLFLVSFVGLSMAGLILAFHPFLLSLYHVVPGDVGSVAEIAYQTARTRIFVSTIPFFLCGIAEIEMGVMRGLGKSVPPMILSIFSSCILRIVWSVFVFPRYMTVFNLLLCFPVSWGLISIVGFFLAGHFVKSAQKACQKREINAVN